jgi:5'-3' exonuclease
MKVVVVTGDKDLMQIVTDQVTLLDTMKGQDHRNPRSAGALRS